MLRYWTMFYGCLLFRCYVWPKYCQKPKKIKLFHRGESDLLFYSNHSVEMQLFCLYEYISFTLSVDFNECRNEKKKWNKNAKHMCEANGSKKFIMLNTYSSLMYNLNLYSWRWKQDATAEQRDYRQNWKKKKQNNNNTVYSMR